MTGANEKYIHIYFHIYIYSHPLTDCFAVSQLFSVARHVRCLKLGSKPAPLYVRLNIRPLGQQAYHVGLGNYEVLCSNSSSSVRLFTFLYLIGNQSAQFVQRALRYASGSRKLLRQSAQLPWVGEHIYYQIALTAWSSKTLLRYPSLSSIAPGWSSKLYPVSLQSWSL